jgi:hypothetical protein
MFLTKLVEKIKTHVSRSANFFLENRAFIDNVERARQAADGNMTHAHCMRDN